MPASTKVPVLTGWQQLRLTDEDLPRHFNGTGNLGLLLGEPSGWLVDVDLDCDEAVALAPEFLPPTGAKSGRAGKPASHWWYVCEGAKTRKHQDPVSKKMIVELRSTGAQTVVGPSIHPSGEPYDPVEGEPAVIDHAELAAAVTALAEAVLERRGRRSRSLDQRSPLVKSALPAIPSEHIERRAAAYLDRIPPAISGSGGHGQTYAAATAMVHGFGLDPEAAFSLLWDRYNPRCEPPWSEKELRHKVTDAASKPHDRPFGWLRDSGPAEATDVDLSGLVVRARAPVADAISSPAPEDPGLLPPEALRVPGFVGEVMDYCLDSLVQEPYGGISRRVSTILGPHSSTGSGDASTTLDTDTTKVGLEGLDRFGRRVDVHWKGSNGSTLRRDQMGYDAGDRMAYALVTQAPELTPAAAVKSRSALHTYDLLGRLIASKYGTLTLPDNNAPPSETNIPAMSPSASWWNDSWTLDYNGNWVGVPVGEGMQGEGSYGRVTTGQLDFFGTPWALPGADAAAEERKIRDALGQGSCIKEREGAATGGAPGVPAGRFRYDPAGNLTCDGRFIYQYDSWSRLVEIRQGSFNESTRKYVPGPVVKRFAYDGLGRLVRTLSPWPSPELFATSGMKYRTERYYYDGMRRVAEVTTDPALSVAAAKDELPPGELATLTVDGEMLAGPDSIDVPLTFESKQKNLTVPPAVYLSREYVWGPGDNGVDELLCQWAWPSRDVPWWVISNVSGDCVAMVTQATVGTPSRVAWQGAYDAYGQVIASRSIVSHPPLRAGHKGLFVERLDGGVAWLTGTPTLGDLDRCRLEPPATIVYHNRNRTLSPGLGRFLQSDPNASGVGLVSSVPYSGVVVGVSVLGADLWWMGGDGVNLYQYCRGNPIGWWDPTGLQAAITGPGTSANPVGALAGGALIGLLLFTQTEVYQSAISAAASGVSLYAGRAFDAGELMFTYAESAVLSVSIALGSGAHSIRQGEALDDIKTKIPVIEEHLRKLAALGLAATGGPKGEPPRDPRNHWLEEIRAQLRYIENKLKNLKGKTYREWSQRLELWKKDFMDQGGKW